MNRRPPVAVGVDGGGTTLRAVVVDVSGAERARHASPSPRSDGGGGVPDPAAVAGAVRELVATVCGRAGVALPVDALWAGLAGAGREPARAAFERALRDSRLAERVSVGTDVEAAFHDAFDRGPGLLLMAGTGSIAWGRGESGRTARAGGWGPLLGDEGSGWAIGLRALRRIARAADGRIGPTDLESRVLSALGLEAPEALIGWAAAANRSAVAALVSSVAAGAEAGDAEARSILGEAADALVAHLPPLLDRLGPWKEPPTVALGGGLLEAGGPLHDRVVARLGPLGLVWLGRALDPARGAARLALGSPGSEESRDLGPS